MKKKYPLPAGCEIKSITIKELHGGDVAAANAMAAGKTDDPNLLASMMMDEKVRASIVRVDGQDVTQPYLPYDEWKQKTKDFVFFAYQELNGISMDEKATFLAGGEVEP